MTPIIDLYGDKNRFCQAEKEKNLKFVGATVLIIALVFGAAFIGGAFEADIEVKINDSVKQNVVEFTIGTIEKAKESADKVLTRLQKKIADEAKEKDTNEYPNN